MSICNRVGPRLLAPAHHVAHVTRLLSTAKSYTYDVPSDTTDPFHLQVDAISEEVSQQESFASRLKRLPVTSKSRYSDTQRNLSKINDRSSSLVPESELPGKPWKKRKSWLEEDTTGRGQSHPGRVVHPPRTIDRRKPEPKTVIRPTKGGNAERHLGATAGNEGGKASSLSQLQELVVESMANTFTESRPIKKKKKKKEKKPKDKEIGATTSSISSQTSGWPGEPWANAAGKGRRDSPQREESKRPVPPHIKNPLSYERRVEGIIPPSDKPTLQDVKPSSQHLPIAQLAHGLDRVLFNPGVHWLQDPRSRVYNFPPYLEKIPKVQDFAFERLSGFIKSSRDEDLWNLARDHRRTFAGSTSSLSGMMSQIYFLLSGDKDVDTSVLSRAFTNEPKNFTPGQRMPASVIFNYNDGVYTIDSGGDSDVAGKNILTWMGTLLEKFVTAPPDEFANYMRSEAPSPGKTEQPLREAYRYAKSGRFVMRSQLDCVDKRLPGTGVFDIKTRACLPIRLDLLNFEENSGYLIRGQHGLMESFEREYYDLIRSAFLKYSFQVRIGDMDGVIVAYHNTERMFGFQYVPLEEMDQRLFGSAPGAGDRVFDKCINVLEHVADEVIKCFPEQSVMCTFETEEGKDVMNVWVQPVKWESEGLRPIKQLEIKLNNYIDEDPVRGSTAVGSSSGAWTTHWSISRLTNGEGEIRAGLEAAANRQFRAYNIPTGVDHADMAEFWDKLNFGHSEGRKVPYQEKNFQVARGNIQRLRQLAREGREDTERMAVEEAGRLKWVLGEPEPIPADVAQEEGIGAAVVDGVVEDMPEGGSTFCEDYLKPVPEDVKLDTVACDWGKPKET